MQQDSKHQQGGGCRYDDSDWKTKVDEHLWSSDNSLTTRVTVLEERIKSQRFWIPVLFSTLSAGLYLIIQIVVDLVKL